MLIISIILVVALLLVLGSIFYFGPKFLEHVLKTISDSITSIGNAQAESIKSVLGVDTTIEQPYSGYNEHVQAYAAEQEPPVEIPSWEKDIPEFDLEGDGWLRADNRATEYPQP